MRARRLHNVPGFGIDKVAAAAGHDPDILRLENLDIDLPPPPGSSKRPAKRSGRTSTTATFPSRGVLT
jgi:hypothetical protein